MSRKWARFRLAAVIFSSLVALGLLALAWTLPHTVGSQARGMLVVLGVVLPIGFYCITTVTGWMRSTDTGVAPPALVGRIIKSGLAPFMPVVFMLFLIGLLMQLSGVLDKDLKSSATDDDTRPASQGN